MRIKYLILYVAFVGMLLAWYVFKKVHLVDYRPAAALAVTYYERLSEGDTPRAFAMYSDGFRKDQGNRWLGFLSEMQMKHSRVSGVRFLDATFVPESGGFFLLRYEVARDKLFSEEQLLISQSPNPTIAGHKIIRLDTKQEITAGRAVTQVGTKSREP